MWAYRRREDGKYEIYNTQTGQTDGQVYDTPTAALKAIAAANRGGALPTATPVPPTITTPQPSITPPSLPGGGLATPTPAPTATATPAPAAPPAAPAPAPAPPAQIAPNSGMPNLDGVSPDALATLYEAAAAAGFVGDSLHRAVATALAESPGARVGRWSDQNMNGEKSIGPWQINLDAHAANVPGTSLAAKIAWLSDPYNAAQMAFRISSGGTDFSPWSVWHQTIKSGGKTINVGAPAAAIYENLWAQAAAGATGGGVPGQIQPPSLPSAGLADVNAPTAPGFTPAAPPPPPRIWDYFVDPKTGDPYIEIIETGDVFKLPPGAQEDSVEAIYAVLLNLPPDSPNRAVIAQEFELAKQDQGVDEFGRPYAGTNELGQSFSTRYSGPPLPEALPQWMQNDIITNGDFVDFERQRRRGLNFDLYGEPSFARLPSGQLVVDYANNPAMAGVTGPVFANGGRVFRNLEEAQDAEYALGVASAMEPTARMRALDWDPEADYGFATNDELLAALDKAEAAQRRGSRGGGGGRRGSSVVSMPTGDTRTSSFVTLQGQGVNDVAGTEVVETPVMGQFSIHGARFNPDFSRWATPSQISVPAMEPELAPNPRDVISEHRRMQLATIGYGY